MSRYKAWTAVQNCTSIGNAGPSRSALTLPGSAPFHPLHSGRPYVPCPARRSWSSAGLSLSAALLGLSRSAPASSPLVNISSPHTAGSAMPGRGRRRTSTFRCHGSSLDTEEGVQVRHNGRLYPLYNKKQEPTQADYRTGNLDFVIREPQAGQAYCIVESTQSATPVIRARSTLQTNSADALMVVDRIGGSCAHTLRDRDTGQAFSGNSGGNAMFHCLPHKATDRFIDVVNYTGAVVSGPALRGDSPVQQPRRSNGPRREPKSGCCIQ